MRFKTSSAIKSIVGKDLITDRYIAIFELVKNSYDARATEVIVSFNTSEDSEEGIGNLDNGTLYIVDNGIGMSKDDLENKWLNLAYSDKQEGLQNEDDSLRKIKNRVSVGSKGIGRFSSDSLGSVITVRTKIKTENFEHQIKINWDKFDEDKKTLFEEIDINYNDSKKLSRTDVDSYTIIEISKFRDSWTKEELDGVVEKLRRLKNPFLENDDLNIYCGINIFNPDKKTHLNRINLIQSNISDVLKEKSINIKASIKKIDVDRCRIEISLTDRGSLVYKVEKTDKFILSQVDNIEISVNYLTTSAKSTFTRRMGVQPINYGNIFIYRNDFHVSPYGDEHYDIFGLNIRKTQGYNRYLATRELIGFISIKDSKNLFKETSSRNNGFIENGYFKALEEFYMNFVHRPLERYVQIVKWGEVKNNGEELHLEDISIDNNTKENFKKYICRDGFEIINFNSELDFEKNKPEKIIERIADKINDPSPADNKKDIEKDTKKLGKQFKELEKERVEAEKKAAEIKRKNKALQRQNQNLVNKRDSKSYSENITHHFTGLADNLHYALESLAKIKNEINEFAMNDYLSAVDDIKLTKLEIEVFRQLLLETSFDLKSGEVIDWYEMTKWYLEQGGRDKYYENFKATCNLNADSSTNWFIDSTHIELVMMIENFYRNAYEHGASFIDFTFGKDCLEVSSDSKPIDESLLDSIFELGFSTKPNGTGIGLSQIKQFLQDVDLSIKAYNQDGLVKFNIGKNA